VIHMVFSVRISMDLDTITWIIFVSFLAGLLIASVGWWRR